jgi:PAS domain S-box-containing protein
MSIVTAIEFALFAFAILLPRERSLLTNTMFLTATTLGALIALLAVIGYAYRLPIFYTPLPASSIAAHTATAFGLLFAGAIATRADIGWLGLARAQGRVSVIARWLMPTVIIVPLLLGGAALSMVSSGALDARTAVALFAIANVAVLGAIAWLGASVANRLQLALSRREQLYKSAIESALDALMVMDAQGQIIEWNPQAERIFGWPREEAIGRTIKETIVPPESRDAHAAGLNRYLATGDQRILGRRVEVLAQRRDGQRLPVELIVVPMQFGAERVFSGFARDLSTIKSAEEQLRQAQKMEAIGQLTGGVAHDFNNRLTVIISMLDSVVERVPPDVRARVEMALQSAERSAGLISQLLSFSRRQVLNPERVDFNEVARGMEDVLKRTLGEHIIVDLQLAPNLSATMADRTQLEAAMLNLAINARDAMPSGGKITIETAEVELDETYAAQNADVTPGRYLMLAVSDTGTGMSPEVLSRAFEPFFSTKEVGQGTGLGLSMIHGFARQSNGHFNIYSELGHGTTARLYLPIRREARTPTAGAAPEVECERGSETVLLVEDDASVRATAVLHLRDLGYHVIEASDGIAARAILETDTTIDLLFTDVVMPGGVTGGQLAKEAQARRPHLKVLFTSGYTSNSIVHHGRLDPGVHFLSKPYRISELAQKMREALDSTVAA